MKTEDVLYTAGSLRMSGLAAFDETINGQRPGVLVVHEGWGLGEHVIDRAKMLADMGYVAFAADMYGERRQVTKLPDVMAMIGELRANPQKLRQRARAALAALAELPHADPDRIAGIGFCFGGTTVLEMARDGANLAGVVSFHGGLETTAPAAPGKVKARILVCTGAEDPMIPPKQVQTFEEEMQKAGANYRVISYPGAAHSFTNPKADGAIAPGLCYNEKADRASWAAMQAFFDEIFTGQRAA
jgi:dienelactone hydrolase